MFLIETAPSVSCGTFGCWTDTISKVVTAVSAICGGFWTIWLYREARRKEAKTAALTAKQPFLMKRLDLYAEATLCAARIAIGDDDPETAIAKRRFLDLYWGPMAIVEDRKVERAMVAFEQAISEQASREVLEAAAIQLAHSCRDSLAKSWHLDDPTGDI